MSQAHLTAGPIFGSWANAVLRKGDQKMKCAGGIDTNACKAAALLICLLTGLVVVTAILQSAS